MHTISVQLSEPSTHEIVVGTEIKLTDQARHDGYMCYRLLRRGVNFTSPGAEILDRVNAIDGIGSLLYGPTGFIFLMDDHVDRKKLLLQVLDVVGEALGDELRLFTKFGTGRWSEGEVFRGDESRDQIAHLAA